MKNQWISQTNSLNLRVPPLSMGVHPDDPNFLCYNYFIWTQWRPKMAQKIFCGQKVKVKVNSHSRPLRFHHLLLQFLTDLDNSGCILFTIGWTSFCAIRILNFCLRPKWHHLKVCKLRKSVFYNKCQNEMAAILFWDKNSKFWSYKS